MREVSAGPEIILKPTRFFSTATRVLVTPMERAQVTRLICVTGFGAGDSRGRGGFLYSAAFNLLLARIYDDKDLQERIVRRSKLDWVIVRPGDTDQWTEDLSGVGRSARLDQRIRLACRCGGLPRQADRRRGFSAQDAGAHQLTPLQSRSEFRHIVSNRQ
jgi:hypothetical protein